MGRFRFSLETLLKIRASQESSAAQALAQANQEQSRCQSDLDRVMSDSRSLNDSLSEGGVAASISIALRPGLRLSAERARVALTAKQAVVGQCLAEWQQAKLRLSLLEKLREARLKEYQRSERLAEERWLDERVIQSL
jgi:flagellar export protein FliJ